MVKRIVLLTFLFTINIYAQNVYEKNCVSCHAKLPVGIDKFFYQYLLKYSSESNVKASLVNYLKIPTDQNTIMTDEFINLLGIKKPTTLSDKELEEAVDIYWEKYKVFDKLK